MASPRPKFNNPVLLKYLPHVVVDHHAERYKALEELGTAEEEYKPILPDHQETSCVAMFIDVASFTILTAELATFPDGSGQLALALNNLMTGIVGKINKINGDIVKFAGDAILVMWPVKNIEELPAYVNRAVSTGLILAHQPEYNHFKVTDPDEKNYFDNQIQMEEDAHPLADQEKILEIKVGITYGKAKILYLGGVPDNIVKSRCEYLPVGPGLNEAFLAEGKCSPSEVVVPKKVHDMEIIQKYFKMYPAVEKKKKKEPAKYSLFSRQKLTTKGTQKKSKLKIVMGGKPKKTSHGKKKSALPVDLVPRIPTHYVVDDFLEANNPQRIKADLSSFNHIGKALWSYVPVAIVPYFSGISLEFWLPEMRTVTTLFCTLNVGHLNLQKLYGDDSLFDGEKDSEETFLEIKEKLQQVFCAIQVAVFKYQGTVNKFLVDDKGCSVLIAFGLPPFAHVSDPDRSALCSYGIMGALGKIQIGAHIGITTGVVYCGAIGSDSGLSAQRIEYTIIGDPINVAARLMVEAKQRNCGIIMDENTKLLLREKVTTEYLDDVELKGKGKYDCYAVTTTKEDIEDYDNRHSTRLFSSSVFSSQIRLGLEAEQMLSAFTGENLQGKLSKLNLDQEFTSGNFKKRLQVESSHRAANFITIEYLESGEAKAFRLPLGNKLLRKNDDLQKVKIEALKELHTLNWNELGKLPYTPPESNEDPDKKLSGEIKGLWQATDPLTEYLHKVSTRFALFWRFDLDNGPGYFEVNDACSLNRFKLGADALVFRLTHSISSHWKIDSSSFTKFRRGRRETIFKENCFSVVERLQFIANSFYSKHTARGTAVQHNQRTVLLEASNGSGKTFAVSDLINTILKTTNFEVLISGGDPFEDGQNTEPFIVISTVLRQLLDLRMNKLNVNNSSIFNSEFVDGLLQDENPLEKNVPMSPGKRRIYMEIINAALENATAMFETCVTPPEAKANEKENHYFDDSKLYLMNDILGTTFKVEAAVSSATLDSNLFTGSLAASKALSAIITQDNFALGAGFKSKQVDRMSVQINNRMSQKYNVLRHMANIKNTKRKVTNKAFQTQLDEFDSETNRKVEGLEELPTKLSVDSELSHNFSPLNVKNPEEEAHHDAMAERFLNFTSGLFEAIPDDKNTNSIEKPTEPLEEEEKTEEELLYIANMKAKVKLFAAIIAGLTAENVPLLINIDNAHRADPYSLLVIQELTQWWSAANILFLISVRKPFSADVGLTNIGNYVIEAGKRMSVVTLNFNRLDAVGMSDMVVQIENSPNERFNDSQTNTSVLIQQLKDLLRTTRIDLVRDPKFTKHIISVVLKDRGIFDASNHSSELKIDASIIEYLKERAAGHFLYIQEAIQLYFKHELITIEEHTPGLVLTTKGRRLFDKALKPNIQMLSQRTGSIAKIKVKKKERKLRNKSKGSMLSLKVSEGKLEDQIFITPMRNLSRLIPGSLNSAFSEYFDSLRIKEQLLLKCAALVARSNKTISKGQFTFHRVKQVCPFFQDTKTRNSNTEKEVQESFKILQTTQLITRVEKKFSDQDSENVMYTFGSDWYVDILISRLLPTQLDRIKRRIEDFRREAENEFFLKVPERERRFKGYITVKKAGKSGFRKRFGVLEKGTLFLYKDDPAKRSDKDNLRSKIFLHTGAAQVAYYDGPSFKSRVFASANEAHRTFVLKSNRHVEMSKPSHEERMPQQWLCIAKTDKEVQTWLSKVRLQIRLSNSKTVKLQID